MLSNITKDLVDDTSGATAVEYGLVLGLIAIAMIVALQSVADTNAAMWTRVMDESVSAMNNY